MTKIGVPATGDSMDAKVEPHLGQCPYFLVVDVTIMNFRFFPNPTAGATNGSGLQMVEIFAHWGVDVVLTGQINPDAQRRLEAAGIEVVTGVSGKMGDVVGMYLVSKLTPKGG